MKKNHVLKRISISLVFALFCSGFAFSQTEISNATELASIANDLNGNYILTADITLTAEWSPIGNFAGILDGNGHVIRGLTYDNTEGNSVGVFATTTGATIKKIGIENANVIGNKDVAALVGIMTGGLIEECYVSNSYIKGGDHVGSLVGQTTSDALIKNCYASAYILCTSYNTGGLVGSAKTSTVSKCYFSGFVRGMGSSWRSGGLVGYIENGYLPVVEYCVNLSPLIISNSGESLRIIPRTDRSAVLTENYSLNSTLVGTSYDLSTLDIVDENNIHYGSDNYNGANLPSDADAKNSTFYANNLGWDFTEITGVWKMLNDGYPVFQWQNTPVNISILNLDAPDDLDILDNTSYPLSNLSQIDFTKLICSHGVSLGVSCESSKVDISTGLVAKISDDITITANEDVDVNISADNDFVISNTVATITLAPGFPNFLSYPEGVVSPLYNAGPGMAIDQTSVTSEDCKMAVISNTSVDTFSDYIQSLINNGFVQTSTSSLEDNVFYTLVNEDKIYYLYYTSSKSQVRIIQDNASRNLVDELDATVQGTGDTEFYLYSLDHTHGEGQTSKVDYWEIDCGALLIIKLKDNSLFIVDSGHERQSSNAALEGLMNFMYQITGQENGSLINIRAWFFSHAHGDHVYMSYPFLEKYHNILNIESVLTNFPSYQTMNSGYDSGTFLMKESFNTYYPNCKYIKLHTGQHFSLQGVWFDVLHTHEDGVSSAGETMIGNFNDTSTILQITINGSKIMLLGDADSVCQSDMLSMYTSSTLKSECVQTSHHGFNDLTALYSEIGASYALFCNSSENISTTSNAYQGVINASDYVTTLFDDPDTNKLTFDNGDVIAETEPSYRSYFTTVGVPDLTIGAVSSQGNHEDISSVLSKISLADKLIDKSVTGTEGVSTSESAYLMLDGETSTKYCTKNIPSTLSWTMKEQVTLKWYVIYTANDNADHPGRNPQKWGLYGSNNAVTWNLIDAVYDPQLPDENYVGTAFSISDPVPYQYYCFRVESTDGSDVLQFSEIGLYTSEELTTNVDEASVQSNADIRVNNKGNRQVEICYKGEAEAYVSIYDLSGQLFVNKKIQNINTLVTVPVTGIYLVVLKNNETTLVKKIRL
ncbi:T9SS type A sorting domain-containing protein [Plebeiibacterium sediminum]|uniref:T9SS type A sorting domain-containing protein n=1 Tax=Plebeiibacterium sediminum TaxID=2992112 RepID=A0AAE3M640_9BACT|nr:T9SS type A sorting domain-containing protein [Plebeiobacterium sediminum]MCW3787946.1 T9SS type A sorting domain-containing protein [Plebeiobacterium sediminum]